MVRGLDAGKCAVRVSARRALIDARDNIWLKRSMATGQCLEFIVLDLVFIVRELQVRIPAHHLALPLFPPNSLIHLRRKKQGHRTRPRRASERPVCLASSLHHALHAMQPRCSDRVWEPPAARAPVSATLVGCGRSSLSTLKENVCATVAQVQRHGPRVSDVSFLVDLLSASPHVLRSSCREPNRGA